MDILLILIFFGAYWFFKRDGTTGAGSADHDQNDDGGGWRKASRDEDPDEAEYRRYDAWAHEEAAREDEFAQFVDEQNEQERLDRRNHDD